MQKKEKDSNLLLKIQSGSEKAFEKLFKKYYQRLCGYAYTYTGCPHLSEEVVQEVFAKFWEINHQITPTNVCAYLFTSVKNKALDKIKKQNIKKGYISEFTLEKKTKVFQKDISDGDCEFKKEVRKAIDNLPERARLIYILSRKEGLTYKEIAVYLDISIKTVESQMTRALGQLRKQLKEILY